MYTHKYIFYLILAAKSLLIFRLRGVQPYGGAVEPPGSRGCVTFDRCYAEHQLQETIIARGSAYTQLFSFT